MDDYRAGHRGRQVLLESAPAGLPSLRDRVQGLTQYRAGSPLWEAPKDAAPGPDWPAIAERANEMLDCAAWGPPPWPSDRWATLAMVLALASDE